MTKFQPRPRARRRLTAWVRALAGSGALLVAGGLARGAEPSLPAVSSFAPAAQLASGIDDLRSGVVESLASAEAWEKDRDRVAQVAELAAAAAQALARSDEDDPRRAAAVSVEAAARKLAEAESFAEAAAAWASWLPLAASPAGEIPAADAEWQGPGELEALMKQVTAISIKIRRGVTGTRFARTAAENAIQASLLAVIGHTTQFDTNFVEDDADLPAWYEYAGAMRASGAELAAAFGKPDQAAARQALDLLEKSCRDCHAKFAPEVED